MPVPSLPFAISIRYLVDRVDVRVEGALDAAGAAVLTSTAEHVVIDGDHAVTLDLADVDRMDVAGARAVARLASRAPSAGPRLTVRSASRQVQDLLEASAFHGFDAPTDELDLELAHQAVPGVNPFAVADSALQLVTALAEATVTGADGVSVSLHRHGGFMTVAASDERIAQMDRDQYATGQGPCLAAATSGEPVRVDVLATETRWPEFVPRALLGGIASILSSPLRSSTGPVGALNMYCRREHGFDARARELAALFAEQASGILAETVEPALEDGGSRLQEALQTRTTIAQAQGILMARTGGSAEQAYSRLKLDARRTERSVRQVSEATITSAARDKRDSSPDA